MAEGGLKHSNANFAIAVTGHAGPSAADVLGQVHFGISVKDGQGGFKTSTKKVNFCDEDNSLMGNRFKEIRLFILNFHIRFFF